MSLNVTLRKDGEEVYCANITHNLGKMAEAAGLYYAMWRPEEIGAVYAKDVEKDLICGIHALSSNPEIFIKYNPENGWGSYDGLFLFAAKYLLACIKNPDALIEVSR